MRLIPRSYLYVPANRETFFAKALRADADRLILDLEDAVPSGGKAAARQAVHGFLRSLDPAQRPRVFVRLNPGAELADDVAAVLGGIGGVVLPKAESAVDVRALDHLLASIPEGAELAIIPLIESVAGLFALDEIAMASSRVRRFGFGAADFVTDLRGAPTSQRAETLFARSWLVARSRMLRLEAPIAHAFARVPDRAGLGAACAEDRALGFGSRTCVHPSQLDVVNDVFSDVASEARARAILAAYAAAKNVGHGAVLMGDGTLVDAASVKWASQVIDDGRAEPS